MIMLLRLKIRRRFERKDGRISFELEVFLRLLVRGHVHLAADRWAEASKCEQSWEQVEELSTLRHN